MGAATPPDEALRAAVRALREAEAAFNAAEPPLVDHTIYRLRVAEEEISLILRRARAELTKG